MNLRKNHDRKGAIITVLVHVILFLLLIQWVIAKDPAMMDEEGGLLVSFGEVTGGGPDATSEVAETTEQFSEPVPTDPEVTQDEMITQDDNAPEVVKESQTTEQEQTEVEETVDSDFQRRMDRMRERQNAHQNKRTGEGEDDKPGGDSDATDAGPGGSGPGITGDGDWFGSGLAGFGISGGVKVENESQQFGTVKLLVCVDEKGKVVSLDVIGGTTATSSYLQNLAKKAASSYKFSPKSGTDRGGCGNFVIDFDAI